MSAPRAPKATGYARDWLVDRDSGVLTLTLLEHEVVMRAEPHTEAELAHMRKHSGRNHAEAIADAAARFWSAERAARVADCAPMGVAVFTRRVTDRRDPARVPAGHPNALSAVMWSLWVRAATLAPVVEQWTAWHGHAQASQMQVALVNHAIKAWLYACALDRERPR